MVGLRRAAEMQALREQAISEYRKMKNRPAHNGRSSSLGSDPDETVQVRGGRRPRKRLTGDDGSTGRRREPP